MKFNPFKIIGAVAAIISTAKEVWYAIKKDVPRITCPQCSGKGQVYIRKNPDNIPSPEDTLVPCTLCKGSGKIRETEKPKEVKP